MTRAGHVGEGAIQRAAACIAGVLIAFTLLSGFHHHRLDLTRAGSTSSEECAVCQASRKAGVLPNAEPVARPLATRGEAVLAVSCALFTVERHPTASRAPPA